MLGHRCTVLINKFIDSRGSLLLPRRGGWDLECIGHGNKNICSGTHFLDLLFPLFFFFFWNFTKLEGLKLCTCN